MNEKGNPYTKDDIVHNIDKESKDLDVYIEAKADFLIENDDIDFVKQV